MKILIAILLSIIIFASPMYFRNVFKVAYYETILKNNKASFSDEQFRQIEKVAKDKWLFLKLMCCKKYDR